MASNNRSPFAVVNGVVTFNGVPIDQVSSEQRNQFFGRFGNPLYPTRPNASDTGLDYDLRYWEPYQTTGDDGAQVTQHRLRPEYSQYYSQDEDGTLRLKDPYAQGLYRDGQWYSRVGDMLRSVGGEGEISDLNGVIWDDDYGYITPRSNVREYNDTVFTPGMMLLAGGMLGAIGMAGGFSGLLGGAGSGSIFPAGAGIAGPSLETAGIATGALDGLGAVGGGAAAEGLGAGLFPPGAGPGTGPLLETAGMATDVPWYTQALANAGVNLSNPITAARALLGAGSLIDTLTNKPGGNNPGSSLLGGSGPAVQAFNPEGLLSGYRPMQFDPVPFMSGRYGR